MKKRVFAPSALLLFILSLSLPAFSNSSDLKKGIAAYNIGDYSTAWSKLLPLARSGDGIAQLRIGLMHQHGYGFKPDWKQGQNWFDLIRIQPQKTIKNLQDLSRKGDADSQFLLGLTYTYVLEDPTNYAEGIKWLNKSAEGGNAEAMFYLGFYYQDGTIVSKDYVHSFKWFRKSAELGNSDAQCYLAGYYQLGRAVEKDISLYMKWLHKAASGGNMNCQWSLGFGYLEGIDVPKDYVQAYIWIDLAAKKGHYVAGQQREQCLSLMTHEQLITLAERGIAHAQYSLAGMYLEEDSNIPKDYVKGYMWLTLAFRNNEELKEENITEWSKESLKVLAKLMTPDQIKKAERLISKWKPKK